MSKDFDIFLAEMLLMKYANKTCYTMPPQMTFASSLPGKMGNTKMAFFTETRAVYPMATCRQSPYLHMPTIVIVTSFSWRSPRSHYDVILIAMSFYWPREWLWIDSNGKNGN